MSWININLFVIIFLSQGLLACLLTLLSIRVIKSSINFFCFLFPFYIFCFIFLCYEVFSYNRFLIIFNDLSDNPVLISKGITFLPFCILFFVVLVYICFHPRYKNQTDPFYIIIVCLLFLFSLGGISSHEFLIFYIFLESISLCIVGLINLSSNKINASYSSVLYFIVNMIGSLVFLLGGTLLYIQWGTWNFTFISLLQSYSVQDLNFLAYLFDYFGVFLIFSSLLLKLGMFPVHLWLLKVYNGLYNKSLIVFTVFSKPITLLMFYNLYVHFCETAWIVDTSITIIALCSLLLASFLLISECNTRLFLGLLSLMSSGFFLIIMQTIIDLHSSGFVVLYLITQSFSILFLIQFLSFQSDRGEVISDLRFLLNLSEIYPKLNFFFLIILLSIVGLPPFLVSWPKLLLIFCLIKKQQIFLIIFINFINILNCLALLRLFFYSSVSRKPYCRFSFVISPSEMLFLKAVIYAFFTVTIFLISFFFNLFTSYDPQIFVYFLATI